MLKLVVCNREQEIIPILDNMGDSSSPVGDPNVADFEIIPAPPIRTKKLKKSPRNISDTSAETFAE